MINDCWFIGLKNISAFVMLCAAVLAVAQFFHYFQLIHSTTFII